MTRNSFVCSLMVALSLSVCHIAFAQTQTAQPSIEINEDALQALSGRATTTASPTEQAPKVMPPGRQGYSDSGDQVKLRDGNVVSFQGDGAPQSQATSQPPAAIIAPVSSGTGSGKLIWVTGPEGKKLTPTSKPKKKKKTPKPQSAEEDRQCPCPEDESSSAPVAIETPVETPADRQAKRRAKMAEEKAAAKAKAEEEAAAPVPAVEVEEKKPEATTPAADVPDAADVPPPPPAPPAPPAAGMVPPPPPAPPAPPAAGMVPPPPPAPPAPPAAGMVPPPPPAPPAPPAAGMVPPPPPAPPAEADTLKPATAGTVATPDAPKKTLPAGKADLSITFKQTETTLPLSLKDQVDVLVAKLKADESLRVNLVAYATAAADQSSTARRVSLSRALSVRAYFIDNGINNLRVNVQAEGDKNPGGEPDRVDIFVVSQ